MQCLIKGDLPKVCVSLSYNINILYIYFPQLSDNMKICFSNVKMILQSIPVDYFMELQVTEFKEEMSHRPKTF